ncbi:Efflux pump membrane transporter BepE [Posidoniimonas corsicana]|uniref:Efflux pump membrane transporter BepE n=1 Tax=Posidoniimonas corsicana TaxID=1938618 RepID=A0A5C5USH1_9BACT|nr:multidrug efflux RND transporter permease subunit [Posidoniimonas corsicana]TWT29324.1 Efflux pump membrane transporter BepE [Posidoniimonas corsicana]
MISRFFIERPVFASVISLLITLAGALAVFTLPVSQYPEITPPTIQVIARYPGASARTMADTIASPIEQQVNGVEGMLYMSSQSSNDGTYMLTVTFALETDIDEAMVAVQNRVSLAMPQLPQIVQVQGVVVQKKSPDILLVVNLVSPNQTYDTLYMSNYATLHVIDELSRIDGVGDLTFLGQRDYSIRVWLLPDQLAYRRMTPGDVVAALRGQNIQAVMGQLGGAPAASTQQLQLTLSAKGRLGTVEDFEQIVVKTESDGVTRHGPTTRSVLLRDVARVELGSQAIRMTSTLDGMPTVGLALYQLPGANALEVGTAIRAKMKELAGAFPAGLEYAIVYDTTPFTAESIRDVFHTLGEATVLVAVVVLLFLQNWRATIIPLVAVPVAIVGTFAVMAMIGFSLNTLSLFGLVLAVGIVVDDAIVVVENVQRWLEEGLEPREAAIKAMDEVSGPIVAVALVLAAVFLPCAFIAGITGEFFRQFAVTIAVSTAFSAFNSLTLSPVLAARLLRPKGAPRDLVGRALFLLLRWPFGWFNRAFQFSERVYSRAVRAFVRRSLTALLLYAGLLYLTGWSFTHAPQGFIPLQDKGYLLANVQLPDGASMQRTAEVLSRLKQQLLDTPGVAHVITLSGRSILVNANSSNYGTLFIILDPFEERRTLSKNGLLMLMRLRNEYPAKLNDAIVQILPPPPVAGLGVSGGFELMVENRTAAPQQELQHATQTLLDDALASSEIADVFTFRDAEYPSVLLDVDRTHARAMGVAVKEVASTLQSTTGSAYINDFNLFGRRWQVNIQADASRRSQLEDLGRLPLRNTSWSMTPLRAFSTQQIVTGPPIVFRYNIYESAPVMGRADFGVSSGEAIRVVDKLASESLTDGMQHEWTGLSYMQVEAGDTAVYIFAMSVVFVFLVLSALYESWALPLAIIMVVPLGLLFSILGVWAFPVMNVDIFTQIGFVVLVGLSCKNAVLIVEFAKQLQDQGAELFDAVVEAAEVRLRPIVMTSCAFLLGVLPLVVGTGAGAGMRRALGVAMFCGMFGVTLFGIVLTPVFYYLIRRVGAAGLLSSPVMRRAVGLLVGPGVGGLLGLLVWRVSPLSFWWSILVGLVLGLLAGAAVLGLPRPSIRHAELREETA